MKGISASHKVLPTLARRTFAICAVTLFVCCASALALDPSKAVGQYVHDAWQMKDGLPDDVIEKVAQTPDGYLWLATSQGLVRFDGARFVTFDRRNTTGLTNFDILTLAVDRAGTLWVGTDGGGLVRFRDEKFDALTRRAKAC
ncbi:MAG TPA: two-component regulator propeller domain-containing protein [Pyrinomonadaceae bacterium]|jgi:ligand-binding sensor domain-containing protein|nr:two-component regulator propeller domain-containing protein [Pyrinomonadaceae bacterium]